MQQDELRSFIQNNAYGIFQFINEEVLKDIGVMNPDYFVKLIDNVFIQNIEQIIKDENLRLDTLAYVLFAHVFGTGHIAFTSLRRESINFEQINKEASVYYNYVQFSIKNDKLNVSLMQSKIGGMPIDADIVKFNKEVTMNKEGFSNYINNSIGNESAQKMQTRIQELFNVK